MIYNTKRNKLIIREYGRNVQKMVEDAMAIEDREKRNETCRAIVRTMAQLNEVRDPSNVAKQETTDYWHKLWDHLFIMSDYQLDIDAPFPKPEPDNHQRKITKPDYNKHHIVFRTYGRNMANVIKKVCEYPADARENMSKVLANDIKMMYLAYNRNSVNDELITRQLREMSGGQLSIPEDFTYTPTNQLLHMVNSNTSFYVTSTKKKKKKKKKKKNTTTK